MFHEIVYTHCSQGIKLNTKEKISGNGFKVYACDDFFAKTNGIDFPFLENAVAMRQSFDKSTVMDDAYLYYVPDTMEPFLVNFHPFKLGSPPEDTGYGKYLNHLFMGDFSQIYPCETFDEPENWDAKEKGSNYYYINSPAEKLEPRENLITAKKYERIREFIANGRTEALKSIVAFLISQYEMPIEERKFLVIIDESAGNIENWISAMEYAFSPCISASIPFATRMDKFEKNNYYRVNKNDKRYKENVNFQESNQELRFRAMIVGVDLRDSENTSNILSLPNLPYVILDGKKKEPLHGVNINESYYELITTFNNEHSFFCGSFLQKLKKAKKEPSREIYSLYDIFTRLTMKNSELSVDEILSGLDLLSNYEPENDIYKVIYEKICFQIPYYIRSNIESTLKLYFEYLVPMADITHDKELRDRFSSEICEQFIEKLDNELDNENNLEFLKIVEKHDEFIKELVNKILEHEFDLKTLSSVEVFAKIIINCALIIDKFDEKIRSNLQKILVRCFENDDQNCSLEIIKMLSQNIADVQEFVLSLTIGKDENFVKFILDCLIDIDNKLFSSNDAVLSLCDKVNKAESGLGIIKELLLKRIENIRDIDSLGQFKKEIRIKYWYKDLTPKELTGYINKRCSEIVGILPGFSTSNKKTEEFCKELIIKDFRGRVIIENILLRRLQEINMIEELIEFKSSKCLSLMEKNLPDIMESDKEINARMEAILSQEIKSSSEMFYVNKKAEKYCKMLYENNFKRFVKIILMERLCHIDNSSIELKVFIKILDKFISKKYIGETELKELLEICDSKINVLDRDAREISASLLEISTSYKLNIQCMNSAHAYALHILSNRKMRKNLEDEFEKLSKFNFPSLHNKQYSQTLAKYFLQSRLNKDEMIYMYKLLINTTTEIYIYSFIYEIIMIAKKKIKICKMLLLSINSDNSRSKNIVNEAFCDAINQYSAKDIKNILLKLEDVWFHKYIAKMVIKKRMFKSIEIQEYIINSLDDDSDKKDFKENLDKIIKMEIAEAEWNKEMKKVNSFWQFGRKKRLASEEEMMKNFGRVLATKMLVDNKRKVRFMYRENGNDPNDSGWRFFCGDEDQAYTDNPDNIAVYNVQTIIDIDKSIIPHLSSSTGIALERENENDPFKISKDFDFTAKDI